MLNRFYSCYYSWARNTIFLLFWNHPSEAIGSIQCLSIYISFACSRNNCYWPNAKHSSGGIKIYANFNLTASTECFVFDQRTDIRKWAYSPTWPPYFFIIVIFNYLFHFHRNDRNLSHLYFLEQTRTPAYWCYWPSLAITLGKRRSCLSWANSTRLKLP